MGIETALILSTVGLAVGVVAITVLLGLLIRSEEKLAKHGESWFFRKKK